jgi:hypothetical protein
MLFTKIIDVYGENHTKHVNILSGENAEFSNVKLALTSPAGCGRSVGIVRLRTKTTEFRFKAGSTVSYHCALKGQLNILVGPILHYMWRCLTAYWTQS